MFFQTLNDLVSDGSNITLGISKSNGKMHLSILSSQDLPPMNISGTAEELDNEIATVLSEPMAEQQGIIAETETALAESKKKLEEAKKKAESKTKSKTASVKVASKKVDDDYDKLNEELDSAMTTATKSGTKESWEAAREIATKHPKLEKKLKLINKQLKSFEDSMF